MGNGKKIESINAMEYASILDVTNSFGHRVEMSKLKIADGKIFGNCDDWFYEDPCAYFVYDITKDELLEFRDSTAYSNEGAIKGWPLPDELRSFEWNYDRYWSGWRFWLLP
ncbi:MAG: hypothetical protein QM724_01050 [Flavobacteriales bacterium]